MIRPPLASLPWILMASAVLPSCSDGSESPLANGVIGVGGGTLEVTSGSRAGTSVDIPAGALRGDVEIQIFADRATTERGVDIVGPATRFSPIGLQLARDTTFTVVFDTAALPSGTAASDVDSTVFSSSSSHRASRSLGPNPGWGARSSGSHRTSGR